ncbi:MAG: CocE/NonD family hydrolase, partial [Pseudomonadota bacterium]
TWGGQINHIFIVENVRSDGVATVIYAIGENGSGPGRWMRTKAQIDGDEIVVEGNGFTARYRLSPTGRLRAVFGEDRGFAILKQRTLGALKTAPTLDWWSIGELAPLITDLIEDDRPVRLNAVLYPPEGEGPFPLAIVHHGSTGDGRDPEAAKFVWANDWFADMLNARGYLVAFPQRRGRGGSDGLYDEGFAPDRRDGYSPEAVYSIPGADRALEDAEAALAALRRRDDVADGPILLSGISRGGVVALMQAGARPDDIAGVVNFVGGWVSEGWGEAEINPTLFASGGAFGRPVLSVYGEDDTFYSIPHS